MSGSPKVALLLTPDSQILTLELPKTDDAEYTALSTNLGGWIQAVPLAKDLEGLTLWVNEEGKLNGLRMNYLGTRVWEVCYGKTDVIVGNAIITGGTTPTGKTKGLTAKQVAKIRKVIGVEVVRL